MWFLPGKVWCPVWGRGCWQMAVSSSGEASAVTVLKGSCLPVRPPRTWSSRQVHRAGHASEPRVFVCVCVCVWPRLHYSPRLFLPSSATVSTAHCLRLVLPKLPEFCFGRTPSHYIGFFFLVQIYSCLSKHKLQYKHEPIQMNLFKQLKTKNKKPSKWGNFCFPYARCPLK